MFLEYIGKNIEQGRERYVERSVRYCDKWRNIRKKKGMWAYTIKDD